MTIRNIEVLKVCSRLNTTFQKDTLFAEVCRSIAHTSVQNVSNHLFRLIAAGFVEESEGQFLITHKGYRELLDASIYVCELRTLRKKILQQELQIQKEQDKRDKLSVEYADCLKHIITGQVNAL